MKPVLFLGSKSLARQKLLNDMGISFVLVDQNANEVVPPAPSLRELVSAVALQKMDHVAIPAVQQDICFVLTADTMGQDVRGVVHGKPASRVDAIEKIKALRGTGLVGTAFCLDKRRYESGAWIVEERILEYVEARYDFDMPDQWIEQYLERVPQYVDMSGAITVEGYGAQFLKSVDGSYTTILGLPIFEVREALEKIGFFS